jgi:hypothetical protein
MRNENEVRLLMVRAIVLFGLITAAVAGLY